MPPNPPRRAWPAVPSLVLAALALAACASQMEPAQRSISDIAAALGMASEDAARYVPGQLAEVRRQLGELQADFDRQDYGAVLAGAPAALAHARALKGAAAARKAEMTQALEEQWSRLAARLPDHLTVIQSRIEFLAGKSHWKPAAGVDLEAARGSLSDASSLWSKAQAAFATGNLEEAVSSATTLEGRLIGLAGILKVDLPAPAAKVSGVPAAP